MGFLVVFLSIFSNNGEISFFIKYNATLIGERLRFKVGKVLSLPNRYNEKSTKKRNGKLRFLMLLLWRLELDIWNWIFEIGYLTYLIVVTN
jgi:hypothetical protein